MADDENFSGNHLRLASFLRVVERMPQRPSRFQRHVQDTIHPNVGELESLEPPGVTENIDVTQAFSHLNTQKGKKAQSESHLCATVAPENPSEGLTHDISEASMVKANQAASVPIAESATRKVRPIVNSHQASRITYSQKAKAKAKGSPRKSQIPPRTQKRRMAVPVLALVRTRTQDGLPTPGDSDPALASHITQIDPIEESQIMLSTDLTSQRRMLETGQNQAQRNRSPHRYMKASRTTDNRSIVAKRSSTKPSQKMVRSQAQGSNKCIQQSWPGLISVSDGFSAGELAFSAKPPKKRAVVRKQKNAPAERGLHLQLVLGSLPFPPAQAVTPTIASRPASVENAPQTQHVSKDDGTSVISSGTFDFAQRPPQMESRGDVQDQSCGAAELISQQLRNVTAPARDKSETSQSEEDVQDHEAGNQGNDVEDTDGDSHSSHYDEDSTYTSTQIEEPIYFEHAMYDVDREGSRDEHFWTQYGGGNI